jgi:hypothetical protein
MRGHEDETRQEGEPEQHTTTTTTTDDEYKTPDDDDEDAAAVDSALKDTERDSVLVRYTNNETGDIETVEYLKPAKSLEQGLNEVCLKPVPYDKIKAVVRAMEKEFLRLTSLRQRDQVLERKRLAKEMADRKNGVYKAPPVPAAPKKSNAPHINYLSCEFETLMSRIKVPVNIPIEV